MVKLPGVRGACDPALDQAGLFATGLDHIRTLAGKLWTDHNLHDPGITTLELLCYTLTDLAYRASFPIEDLIARGDAAQLLTARQILPCAPLTRLDYRKLLIDLVDIKNAWIWPEPVTLYPDPETHTLSLTPTGTSHGREVQVRGLYRVRVELMDDHPTAAKQDAVRATALGKLHAHRNLCEDFVGVDVVETQPFILCGEIEIEPQAVTAEVQAQVLFQVEQYLSPPVFHYTLDELLERRKADGTPYTPEDIFDGPVLEHGFILDDELADAELRKDIRLSDVIAVIHRIAGVRAVRDLLINPAGTTAPLPDRWVVPVEPGKRPTLDRGTSRLVLYKRAVPVPPSSDDVEQRYEALAAAVRTPNKTLSAGARQDLAAPMGRDRGVARYDSFQNHFPAVYGIGEQGLPGGAGPAREAQALQLKAYLLFFDQLMADYCAQLAHVTELFSTDENVQRTYFHQVVDSFGDWSRIYASAPSAVATLDSALRDLDQLDAPPPQDGKASDGGEPPGGPEIGAEQLERRNRFLDHLVARFAERFHDYAAITESLPGSVEARTDDVGDHSPEGAASRIARARKEAALREIEHLRSLIRVKCEFLRSYETISRDRGLGYDHTQSPVWGTEVVSGLEQRVARLLGMPKAMRRDLSHPTEAAVQPGEPHADEGMLVIENLLLRTADWKAPYQPACGDPHCVNCEVDDPYSYRVHVILPAYAQRFRQMDFRRFAEDVIRQEMPAHIAPRICWVSRDDMARIEQAYHAWLEARAHNAADVGVKLDALRAALAAAHNAYQVGTLRKCIPGDEGAKFQLGRTALGKDKS